MAGAHIGPYSVERELGAGGMGTVHLARTRSGRPVAVKVARTELAADASFRARFRAEIDAARRVNGFHTAPVVDADPDGRPPWLATPYVPGPTLATLATTSTNERPRRSQDGICVTPEPDEARGRLFPTQDLRPYCPLWSSA